MTISQALKLYADIEIELLLGHALKQSKEFLYMHPRLKLTPQQTSKLNKLAEKRRAGMPIAYLLGHKYFYGLKFKVTKDTLIPRPETEWLVEKTVDIVNRKLNSKTRSVLRILDMGTGSGCIAISLSKLLDGNKVTIEASDISSKALTVAIENSLTHKAPVKFVQSNLFDKITGRYDIVIANLPYVPVKEYRKLTQALKHEPRTAITDDTDDFKLIRTFLANVKKYLKKDGIVLMEVDPATPGSLKISSKLIHKDFQGLKRYLYFKY